MRLSPTSIWPLVLLPLARADDVPVKNLTMSTLTTAQCGDRADWFLNAKQEDPCTLALDLLKPCSVHNMTQPLGSSSCTCNLVFYNVLSACSLLCVQDGAITYSDWTHGCQVSVTNDYPFSQSYSIPQWAQTPLSGGRFDPLQALSMAHGWSLIQKLAPAIAIIASAIIAFVVWFMRRRRRRSRRAQAGYKLTPLNLHRPSDSQSSVTSSSALTHSRPRDDVSDRSWSHVGSWFVSAKRVRTARRDTHWAIDEDQAEEYARERSRSYYDPYVLRARLQSNHAPDGSSFDGSSMPDPDSSAYDLQNQHQQAWWNPERLKRLFSASRTGTIVPNEDPLSTGAASSHMIGSVDDRRGLYSQPIPPRSDINGYRFPHHIGSSAGRSIHQNETESSRSPDITDGEVLLISRTPGVDFFTTEGTSEERHTVHMDEPREYGVDYPESPSMPKLQLPSVEGLNNGDFLGYGTQSNPAWSAQEANQARLPLDTIMETNNVITSSSPSNAPEPRHTPLAFSHLYSSYIPEYSASSPNLPLGSRINGIGLARNVSAEQLYRPESGRNDHPITLFPSVVKAAGYNVPRMHDAVEKTHATTNNRNGEDVGNVIGDGRVNGHDRIPQERVEVHSTLAATSNYPPWTASLSSAELLDLGHLPPYPTHSNCGSEEPVPPYPISPQHRQHNDSSAHAQKQDHVDHPVFRQQVIDANARRAS